MMTKNTTNKWTIIILGMSGDLGKRKLIPALFALLQKRESPIGLIIGTGRENITVQELINESREHIPTYSQEERTVFLNHTYYQTVDFKNPQDFDALNKLIHDQEIKHNLTGKRIVYCATSSVFFCSITQELIRTHIINNNNLDHRIVYEKPFGSDSNSAHAINTCIRDLISEKQIYRIDHYLAKEFVNNIFLLRYTNTLFKSVWNKHCISAIKILFHETLGISGRGAFYDQYGALKDVVQNHLLQLVALVTMDEPKSLDSEAVRDKKAEILKSIQINNVVLGQYDGYTKEPSIDKNSKTETYAALKITLDHPSWSGVPIYLETGKKLKHKTSEIQILLKPVSHCLWSPNNTCSSNKITIHLAPEEGFSLRINSKTPGTIHDVSTVDFNFSYTSIFGPTSAEAYELLLTDIIEGQQSIVVRSDEIDYQWRVIKKIEELDLAHKTFEYYQENSQGPQAGLKLLNEF